MVWRRARFVNDHTLSDTPGLPFLAESQLGEVLNR
jgi:hypothetical protein